MINLLNILKAIKKGRINEFNNLYSAIDLAQAKEFHLDLINCAIKHQRNEILMILIENKDINYNQTDSNGQLVLKNLIYNYDSQSINFIVKKLNIDLNVVDEKKENALFWALNGLDIETLFFLVKQNINFLQKNDENLYCHDVAFKNKNVAQGRMLKYYFNFMKIKTN